MPRSASLRLRVILIAAAFGVIAAACGASTENVAVEEAAAPESETEAPAEESEEAGDSDEAVTETPAADAGLFGGEFVDLNGESIDLASFEGQDVVLWFWAPW